MSWQAERTGSDGERDSRNGTEGRTLVSEEVVSDEHTSSWIARRTMGALSVASLSLREPSMTTTRPTRAQGREVNHKPHAELSGILQGGRSVAEFGTVRRKQSGVWIRIEERSKECSRVERAWDRERRGEREYERGVEERE